MDGGAVSWHGASSYKTPSELSRMLDDLRSSVPGLRAKYRNDEDFWAAFRRAADGIKDCAMGFTVDHVADRLDAMEAEIRADAAMTPENLPASKGSAL
jgi:hypothetical protein